jgi:hypothetical protein
VLLEPLDLGGLPNVTSNPDEKSYRIGDFEIIPKDAGERLLAVSLWQNQEEALAKVAESIRQAVRQQ